MILIIDEWLWHDITGENGEEKRKESFKFLECILKICDEIAIMKKSKFSKKLWKVAKNKDLKTIKIVKFFISKILHNSRKCRIYEYENKHYLGGIKEDDIYLYNLYILIEEKEKCIITTDNPLLNVLKNHKIKVCSREKFIKSYLKNCEETK